MDAKTKKKLKSKYKVTNIIGYVLLALMMLSIIIIFIVGEDYLLFFIISFLINLFGFLIINTFNGFYENKLKAYKFKIIEYRDYHHFQHIMKLLKEGNVQGACNIYNDCNITNSDIKTYTFTFLISACSYCDNKILHDVGETKIRMLINQYNPKIIFN